MTREQEILLKMAKKALSADTSSDPISRANAIRWVKTECNPYGKPTLDYDSGLKVIEHLKKMPSELPSTEAEWIPCSERLPKDSGEYLVRPSDGVLEDCSDFSEVMIMPYDEECEAFGWWTERYDPISLGFVDSDFNEFEVIAWMPLPEPYREDGEEWKI